MSSFIQAHSLDKSVDSASHGLFFTVIATSVVLVLMLLFRKSLPYSFVEAVVFDTTSPQRPARAKQAKAFWKKTMRRDQRRALKAQDIQTCLMHEEQDEHKDAIDVENAGLCVDTTSPFQQDCHVVEIQVGSMSGCIIAGAEDLCDHASQDDQSDEVQPHDTRVTGADGMSLVAHQVPGFEIADENIAIHNNKSICTCSGSSSWGCVQHRTYRKELLLAKRLHLALPRDAGVGADSSSFFILLAEPPGLERLTRMR